MKLKIILITFFLIFILFFKFNNNSQLSQKIITPITDFSIPKIVSQPTNASTVTFGLMGDLGLGRYITSIARSKNDFSWSFSGVSSTIQQNDFNLANLESPIIDNCPEGKTGTFTFCGDDKFIPQLKENKFILNLANNHIFNYGQDGFNQTKTFLTQANIDFFYSHNSDTEFIQKEISGIKFGFLGFDYISNPNLDSQMILNLIKKYDPQVNWLIVSIHWGNEYLPQVESWRVSLAHQMIDAGADIIHGHHPHVLQEYEVYQGKNIYYSLGNFIFDQSWSRETSTSEIITLTVNKNKIVEQKISPIIIKLNSRPEYIN